MANNRFDYVKYDKPAEQLQVGFKEVFMNLSTAVEALAPGRASALALTKLEESYMWVGKAIRDDQIKRTGCAELNEKRG